MTTDLPGGPPDLPPTDPNNRSPSTTDATEMSNNTRQSSRELNSAAIENQRLAQDAQRHADSLQAQISALLAQQQAAEESSRKYHEEAEARQQDAREQSFFEVQIAKQVDFRHVLADEVFVRVARELRRDDDWEYVRALAERRLGFEDPVLFKCLLWDAVSGNESESDFLTTAAQKVLDRLDKKIGDADVAAIKSSVVCLALNVGATKDDHVQTPGSCEAASEPESAYHVRDGTPSPTNVDKAPIRAVDVVDENQMHVPTDNHVEEPSPRSQETPAVRNSSSEARQNEHNAQHSESPLKQESVIPQPASAGRRSMDEIDNEHANISAQPRTSISTDNLNDCLHDEDADLLSPRGRPTTPAATPSKRPRDDTSLISNSKRTSQPKTPKRPRTAKDAHPSSKSVGGRKQSLS